MSDKVNIQEIVVDKINSCNSLFSKAAANIDSHLQQIKSKFGQARTFIGLDMGTSSVKVVQMARVQGDLVLTKASIVEIDLANKENLPQATTSDALKKALVDFDTKGSKIICAVNCPKTYAKQIITPFMPKQELPEAVRWEMKNQVPYSLDEAVLDFEILGEVVDKGLKKLSVAVAVSPKETINNQLYLLNQLGLKISAIVPHAIALQGLIAKSKSKSVETIAVIEMGASLTELNIYKDARLEFSRKLPTSGIDITKELTTPLSSAQGRVELSMLEAEKIKRDYGMPSEGWTNLIEGKISTSQILSLVRPKVEQLATDIGRSFDFYREGMHGAKVDRIILCGGTAQLRGLAEFLKNELAMDVKISNPLEDVRALLTASKEIDVLAHRFDLAIAAALYGSEGAGVNLLPIEVKEETKRFIEKFSLKAMVISCVVIVALFYIGMRVQLSAYNKKLHALQVEYKSLTLQVTELRDSIFLDQALKNKPYWDDVLIELSNIIPEDIYLTSLSMDNGIVTLKGVITQGGQPAEAVLSNFMLTLENGIFKNVSLVNSKKNPDNSAGSEFEIKCEID